MSLQGHREIRGNPGLGVNRLGVGGSGRWPIGSQAEVGTLVGLQLGWEAGLSLD